MQDKLGSCAVKAVKTSKIIAVAMPMALALTLLTTGCTVSLSPLARHTAAFSKATTSIVDRSEDAYRSALQLHHEELVAKAVSAFNNDPSWNPYTALGAPLLSPAQLDARIKVLDGLKVYAESLVELTGRKKQTAELEDAATAAGSSLQGLSTSATPALQKLFPSISAMTDTETNVVSTAIVALSGFLINGKIHKSLVQTTQDMDPTVAALCRLIDSDVKVMRSQADVDYQSMMTNENQLILHAQIDPVLRRGQIAKLIEMAARQQDNDALLEKLQKAIVSLALTHHALAAAAQGNNPQSVQQRVADLVSAGQELGNYYKSLPTAN